MGFIEADVLVIKAEYVTNNGCLNQSQLHLLSMSQQKSQPRVMQIENYMLNSNIRLF